MDSVEVGAIPPVPSAPLPGRPLHISATSDGEAMIYGTSCGVVLRYLPGFFDPSTRLVETFKASRKPIVFVTASPDGRLLVGGDGAGTLFLWTLRRKAQLRLERQNTLSGSSAAASPGGSPADLRVLRLDSMPYVRITDVRFGDGGRKMAVAGVDKYGKKLAACVFTDGGSPCGKIEGHTLGVHSIDFQPVKPHYIVSAGVDGKLIVHKGTPYSIFVENLMTPVGEDVVQGPPAPETPGSPGAPKASGAPPLHCVRFAPAGDVLAVCGAAGAVLLFNFATADFALIRTIQGPAAPTPAPIFALAWNPAASGHFAAVDAKRHIFIADAATGEHTAIAEATETESAVGITWTKTDWLVTMSESGRIQGLRAASGGSAFARPLERFTWMGLRGICSCIAANIVGGQLLLGDSLGYLMFLSIRDADPEVFNTLKLPSDITVRCAAMASGVATVCTNDGTLRIFNVPNDLDIAYAEAAAADDGGEGGADGNGEGGGGGGTGGGDSDENPASPTSPSGIQRVQLQSTTNELPVHLIGEHTFGETPVACLNVLSEVAVVVPCASGSVYAYATPEGDSAELKPLWWFQIEGAITAASVSIDGTLVAICVQPTAAYAPEKLGDDDREAVPQDSAIIEMYEVDDITEEGFRFVCAYEFRNTEITAQAMSPDGMHVAFATSRREIHVFRVESGREVVTTEWVYHSTKVNCLDWSPDGTKIISGSLDRDAWVCDVQYPTRVLRICDAHPSGITNVLFILNNVVLTAGADGVLSLHEISFKPPPPGVKPYIATDPREIELDEETSAGE